MAAGLGFKTFTTGEVLTAGDVNGYLMQGINVFTNATARDAAITSPQEGQFAFTKDNNSLWYYDGAAWVASGATGDIEGVTAGVGISGGGTSGTVTITNSMATAIDAKGDLVAGTGADAFSRLAVGSNDQVLTADSSAATGLKWATPAAASQTWTLLNTGGTSLTTGTTTISGISGRSAIMIQIVGASQTSGNNAYQFRINADSGSNYEYFYNVWARAASFTTEYNYIGGSLTSTDCVLGYNGSAAANFSGTILLGNCNSTSRKTIQTVVGAGFNSGAGAQNTVGQGFYKGTSTVSSISLIVESGTFDGGTVYVYGA